MTNDRFSVCITVDVEDFFLPRPPGFDTVFARTASGEFGIGRIMQILEEHGACGTFFVDVYNRETLDENTLREACVSIVERGHEVGLHTHPAFPQGRRGYGMQQILSKYDLAWQTEFIAQGVNLLQTWCGKPPRVHRAGGYGANLDTLKALEINGIHYDSSLLHGYRGCELNEATRNRNAPADLGGIFELPISVTSNHFMVKFGGLKLQPYAMVQKVDLDWLDASELERQISALHAHGVDPIIIFMHSYSLLDLNNHFRPHTANIEKFYALLSFLRKSEGCSLDSLSVAADRVRLPGDRISDDPLPDVWFWMNEDWRRWFAWARATVRPSHFRLISDYLRSRYVR